MAEAIEAVMDHTKRDQSPAKLLPPAGQHLMACRSSRIYLPTHENAKEGDRIEKMAIHAAVPARGMGA